MKALPLLGPNKWHEMKIAEMEKPSPKAGQILVHIQAVGLNPVDYKTATNGNPKWAYPHILGVDGAGIVAEVGEGVEDVKVGDRVVYHGSFQQKGTYAEYAVTTAHSVSHIPDDVSFIEAAALPCAGMTAYQALFRKLHIQKGETILIQGAAGGVGGFAVQLAALTGATIIGTASKHNHDFIQSLGAHLMIDYHSEDVKEKVLELTNGRGVDCVLDAVGRKTATDALDMLAFNGRLAYIAGGPDFSLVKPFTKALSFHEIALGGAHLEGGDKEAQIDLKVMGDELLKLVNEKKLNPLVHEIISLHEVPKALQKLSERHVRGKIVADLSTIQ
ncbi:zinc-binding dehydrogenase [Bacillus kexueae]|uniref:zinc-binding dehydrogenase n=1 Tax=Aeribacillus kexueae TaxID=2078952 RepID=UPI001FAEED2D